MRKIQMGLKYEKYMNLWSWKQTTILTRIKVDNSFLAPVVLTLSRLKALTCGRMVLFLKKEKK